MRPTRLPRTIIAASALALALLAGCGDDNAPSGTGTDVSSGTPTTSAPASPSPSPSAADSDGPAPTSTKPVEAGTMAAPAALLKEIRVAHHATYDRVVFEFTGKAPGYRVAYVPRVVMDGSGDPLAVKGSAFLQVSFQGATLDTTFQQGAAGARYTGPKRISAALPEVQEIAFAGDFEAVLSWGIGLTAEKGFRVQTLSDPTRVVIDVATP